MIHQFGMRNGINFPAKYLLSCYTRLQSISLSLHSRCVYISFRIIFNGNDYADCDTTNTLSTEYLELVTPAYKWVLQDGDATNNNSTNTAYPTQLDEIGYFSTPTMNYTESALQSPFTVPWIPDYWRQYWHGPFQRYLNIGSYDDNDYKADCSRVARRVHLRRYGHVG